MQTQYLVQVLQATQRELTFQQSLSCIGLLFTQTVWCDESEISQILCVGYKCNVMLMVGSGQVATDGEWGVTGGGGLRED